jgi:hypothetical protein
MLALPVATKPPVPNVLVNLVAASSVDSASKISYCIFIAFEEGLITGIILDVDCICCNECIV